MRAFGFAMMAGTVIGTETPADDDKVEVNPEEMLKGFLAAKKDGKEGADGQENPLAGIMGMLQGKEGADGEENPMAGIMGMLQGKEGADGEENPMAGIMGMLQGKEGEDGQENPLAGIMGMFQGGEEGEEGGENPLGQMMARIMKKDENGKTPLDNIPEMLENFMPKKQDGEEGEEGDAEGQAPPDFGAMMGNLQGLFAPNEDGKGPDLGGMIQKMMEVLGNPKQGAAPAEEENDDTPMEPEAEAEEEEEEFTFEHLLEQAQHEENMVWKVEDLKALVADLLEGKEEGEDVILGPESVIAAIDQVADGEEQVDIRHVFAALKEQAMGEYPEEFQTDEVLGEMVFDYLPTDETPSLEQWEALFQALTPQ